MRNFTIDNDTNNIAFHGSVKEAEAAPNSERFGTEAALAKLAANWPAARLVEIWNGLPGETPVRKFKDRATAVSRIWKALQNVGQVAPADDEPEPAPSAGLPDQPPIPIRKPANRLSRRRSFPSPRSPPLLPPHDAQFFSMYSSRIAARYLREYWPRPAFRRCAQ